MMDTEFYDAAGVAKVSTDRHNGYNHQLTEIEKACGVTLEAVAHELPRVYMPNSRTVLVDGKVSPALGSSTARAAFGVHDPRSVKFIGMNVVGHLIYERVFNPREA